MSVVALLGAGVLGAVARHLVEMALERRKPTIPWGVLAVNIVGSALLGAIVQLRAAGQIPAQWALVAGTGFCGAFTTYSAFALSTVRTARARPLTAVVTAAAMVVCCAAAAAGGTLLAGVL